MENRNATLAVAIVGAVIIAVIALAPEGNVNGMLRRVGLGEEPPGGAGAAPSPPPNVPADMDVPLKDAGSGRESIDGVDDTEECLAAIQNHVAARAAVLSECIKRNRAIRFEVSVPPEGERLVVKLLDDPSLTAAERGCAKAALLPPKGTREHPAFTTGCSLEVRANHAAEAANGSALQTQVEQRGVLSRGPAAPQRDASETLLPMPNRNEVLSVLRGAGPAVRRCKTHMQGSAPTKLWIAGRTGTVNRAAVTGGPFAGTPAATCIEHALVELKFPQFAQSEMTVAFPFTL
jgi:hypothetical protein